MNEFYQCLPVSERQRVEMLEPFDEFEDFYQKCNHYSLVLAAKGVCDGSIPSHHNTSLTQEVNDCDVVIVDFHTSCALIRR